MRHCPAEGPSPSPLCVVWLRHTVGWGWAFHRPTLLSCGCQRSPTQRHMGQEGMTLALGSADSCGGEAGVQQTQQPFGSKLSLSGDPLAPRIVGEKGGLRMGGEAGQLCACGSFPVSPGPGAASAQTKPARLGEVGVQAPLLAPQGFSAPGLVSGSLADDLGMSLPAAPGVPSA